MLLVAAVVLISFATAQPAIAGGVHFDPDSPAGKEYALPLDQARDEAAGVGKSDGPAGKRAPLFGEGVTKAEPSSPGEAEPRGSGDPEGSPSGQGGEQGAQRIAEPAAVAAAIRSTGGRDYALSSAILWVAGIIALGGLAGLALRAARRRPST